MTQWNEVERSGTNVGLQEGEGKSGSYGLNPVSWRRICELEIGPEFFNNCGNTPAQLYICKDVTERCVRSRCSKNFFVSCGTFGSTPLLAPGRTAVAGIGAAVVLGNFILVQASLQKFPGIKMLKCAECI